MTAHDDRVHLILLELTGARDYRCDGLNIAWSLIA